VHLRDIFHKAKGGSPWSSQLRSDNSRDDQAGEAAPCYQRPRVSRLTQEDYQARVHSDQMVLVIARRKAVPWEWGPTQVLHSLWMLKKVGKQL
jgi:hypothetical protein